MFTLWPVLPIAVLLTTFKCSHNLYQFSWNWIETVLSKKPVSIFFLLYSLNSFLYWHTNPLITISQVMLLGNASSSSSPWVATTDWDKRNSSNFWWSETRWSARQHSWGDTCRDGMRITTRSLWEVIIWVRMSSSVVFDLRPVLVSGLTIDHGPDIEKGAG